MTQTGWRAQFNQVNQTLNPQWAVGSAPELKRLNGWFLAHPQASADNVREPSGRVFRFLQAAPPAPWDDLFERLVEQTVERLAPTMVEQEAGTLVSWFSNQAYRVQKNRLQAAHVFDETNQALPSTRRAFRADASQSVLAWDGSVLQELIGTLWSQAVRATPTPMPKAREADQPGESLLGARLVMRRRPDSYGLTAPSPEWGSLDLMTAALRVKMQREKNWEEAREKERQMLDGEDVENFAGMDARIHALRRGLFGGVAIDNDFDYDEDGEDDGFLNPMDEEDILPPAPPGPAVGPHVGVGIPAELFDTWTGLVPVPDQPADAMKNEDEAVPRSRVDVTVRTLAWKPKPMLPDSMPEDWGLTEWGYEACRFQMAFEHALSECERRLRGFWVEQILSWVDAQPEIKDGWKMATQLWGYRLSPIEVNRLAPSAAIAQQLMNESPSHGLRALRMAPSLGIREVGLDLLGRVKDALRDHGVTGAMWKKSLPKLPHNWMLDVWASDAQGITKTGKTTRSSYVKTHQALDILTFKEKGHWDDQEFFIVSKALRKSSDSLHKAIKFLMKEVQPVRSKADSGLKQEFEQAVIEENVARQARLPSLIKSMLTRMKETSPASFWRNEWPLVYDFLHRSELGVWRNLPEKVTWVNLWRRQEEWHDAILQSEKDKHYRCAWASALPRFQRGEWVAVPLVNGGDLWEEGKAMHHCVSTYAKECKKGHTRIFSVRDTQNRRVATLEINFDGHAWRAAQFMGYCNRPVTQPTLRMFVQNLTLAYRHAELNPELADTLAAPTPPKVEPPAQPKDAPSGAWAAFKASLNLKPPAQPDDDPAARRRPPGP